MTQAAADGTAVAHRMMRDEAIRLDHDRAVLRDLGRPQHSVMGRQCADAQFVADDANVSELVQAADVDQSFGRSEAEIEHRDQALPAGENLGLFSEPGESRECRF